MLALTRRTEYALMAVCHLARTPDDAVVSTRDIAGGQGVQLPLLMNVMKTLTQAGLVASTRGAKGGYRLAIPADQITLGALIHAIEGPVRLVRCVDLGNESAGDDGACELAPICRIRHPVNRVHNRFRQFLDSVTVAEIACGCHDHPTADGATQPYSLGRMTHEISVSR